MHTGGNPQALLTTTNWKELIMAERHSKSGTDADKAAKTERQYLVGYLPQRGDTSTPALNLSGKWLREAGFGVSQKVTVTIEQGCLILTAGG